jgi:DNA-binding IclR family transcriptional regulator
MDLSEIGSKYLEEMKNETGETANLVRLSDDSFEVIYTLQVESASTVGGLSLIGSKAPGYATGVGKVLLADVEWSKVASFYEEAGMKPLTENTVSSISELKKRLKRVERQGYAVDNEECEKGAACIAAPVKNHTGNTIAAVSISGPTGRIMSDNFSELVESVKKKADEISRALGYTDDEH